MTKSFLFAFCCLLMGSLTNAQSHSDSLGYGLFAQSIDYNMVKVEGGTFKMGCSMDVKCVGDEFPVHEVTVSTFYISRFEVKQEEFFTNILLWGYEIPDDFCHTCPVRTGINEALKYISELNRVTGKKYRLPTEAEWEFAARGGNNTNNYKFSGSNNLDEVAWHFQEGVYQAHPIGLLKPNELGLYDMTGNVWEYCSDLYKFDYYKNSPAIDPKGPTREELPANKLKVNVARGGSCMDDEFSSRVFSRGANGGSMRDYIGIRLAHD